MNHKRDFEAERWKFAINMYAMYAQHHKKFSEHAMASLFEATLNRYKLSMQKIRSEFPQFSKVFDEIDKEVSG